MNDSSAPVLLGIGERATKRGHHLDIVGLSFVLELPVFPQPLEGFPIVLAFSKEQIQKMDEFTLVVRSCTNQEHFGELCGGGRPVQTPIQGQEGLEFIQHVGREQRRDFKQGESVSEDTMGAITIPSGSHLVLAMPCPPVDAYGPGFWGIYWRENKVETHLGNVLVGLAETVPMSEEEWRALIAKPSAPKGFSIMISCSACSEEFVCFHSLYPGAVDATAFPDGAIHLDQAPESWNCGCGTTRVPLRALRAGLPNIYRGRTISANGKLLTVPRALQIESIRAIATDYAKLISRDPAEQIIQEFMEANPVIWAFLGPLKILHKPAVLTRYRADFGILSADRTLHLIEIEKPQSRIATKKGGRHKDIQRGFDQIADWREVLTKSRTVVIDELGLHPDEVTGVRYVLIAGDSTREDPASIAKVRAEIPRDTSFYTFDELLAFLQQTEGLIATA